MSFKREGRRKRKSLLILGFSVGDLIFFQSMLRIVYLSVSYSLAWHSTMVEIHMLFLGHQSTGEHPPFGGGHVALHQEQE